MVGLIVAAPGKVTLLRATCGHRYLCTPLGRSRLHTSRGVQGCGNGVAGEGQHPIRELGTGGVGSGLVLPLVTGDICSHSLVGTSEAGPGILLSSQ